MRTLNRRQRILWRATKSRRVAPCNRRIPGRLDSTLFAGGDCSVYLDGVLLRNVIVVGIDGRSPRIERPAIVRGTGVVLITGEIHMDRDGMKTLLAQAQPMDHKGRTDDD